MPDPDAAGPGNGSQLRLLLEEICCDLCRFEHVARDGVPPEAVQIDREVQLGAPDAFADIRVTAPGRSPYFVEVKHGYPAATLLRHLARKYGARPDGGAAPPEGTKVVLVVDLAGRSDRVTLEAGLHGLLPGLTLEVWDEARLLALIRERFGVSLDSLAGQDLVEVRHEIDRAKGFHAFGGDGFATYVNDPLRAQLLWHFGFWRLRQLRDSRGLAPHDLLTPGPYHDVVVVMADLCAFSSYVRDTRRDEVVRDALTAFYSKSRYQIINGGGMLYQFVGDEVIGLFGVPERQPGAAERALDAARGLVDIGRSVAHHWQRQIDRVQVSGGVHIGIAVGELQLLSLRPFSRTYMGVIGDAINMAARLMQVAGPSELVVSNAFYHDLPESAQATFQEIEPVEAHNVGRLKGWRLGLRRP